MKRESTIDPADRNYVSEQYKTASRLDARVRLYKEFGEPGRPSLMSWVFGELGLEPGMRVLEVGCGNGALWQENLERLPLNVSVTLSDNAEPMLAAARQRLGEELFNYALYDVREVAAADESFDVVVANHMLYHIPDRDRALAEIRRVLRPRGRIYATTNGWTHIIELRDLIERLVPEAHVLPARRAANVFDVENGAEELSRAFGDVRVKSYRSALHVTDANVVADYVRSTLQESSSASCADLLAHVQRSIQLQGELYISTWVGLLVGER